MGGACGSLRLCLRSMKSPTMPDSSGPGRKSATSATMSSKRVRLQAPDQVLHAAGFQLEHRGGLRLRHEVVGRLVVHRQLPDVEQRLTARGAARVDDLHGAVDDRERAQSEEVELHEARGLDVVLVELRDDAAALVVGVQRREFRELRRRDHHATGVHAGVAREALERTREVDEILDLLVFLVETLELGLFLDARRRA